MPATDGFAHRRAVQALGVGPADAVRWDDLMAVMIGLSDSAVPDMVRETPGDGALVTAAAAGGWAGPDLPSFGGEGLLTPELFTSEPPPAPQQRRAVALAAQAVGADDPAVAPLLEWSDGGPAGTVTQLAAVQRAAPTAGFGPEVSAIVRGHLERPLADRLRPAWSVPARRAGACRACSPPP